jgi:uncharacterized protein (DUF1697 family)
MRTHVALLRGINVGGRNKVAMAELAALVSGLGHSEVATYIQSGNVVFRSPGRSAAALSAELETAIADRFAVNVPVIVISAAELADVITANPYPDVTEHRYLHAFFRADEFSAQQLSALRDAQDKASTKGSPDEAMIVGRTLYLHTPGGMGRSELAGLLNRGGKASPIAAGTARNWATVLKLHALLA